MTTKASSFHAVGMGDLRWRRETKGVVVINRMFVMDLFRTKSLTSDFLTKIRTDLFTIREGKMTTVLRFCYIFESHDHPPYGDASKNVMLNHIKQLSPILHEFDDVIDAIQAGFIGAWGEWYYTDAFGSPQERDFHKYSSTHGYSPQHIADRKQILEALIDAVPNTIQIMQRYPSWNRMIFGTTPPTLHDVQTHSHKGRVGFHNDCFLSTKNDEGTYSDGIDVDYPYLQEQTKYLLAGGETCSGAKQNPDRHKCSTALHEMALFHWSFLNVEYYKPVLQDWQKHGCFNDIYRRMGYRFVLKEAVMPQTVHHGSDFCFRIVLRNEGFAAPARNWNILLVLKRGSATYAVSIPGHDMRLWLPGQDIVLEHSVHVATNVSSTETYDTFLVFEDQKIPHESDYSILLANDHVPDHHSGMNNLAHKIVVNGGSGHTSSCPSFRRWTPPKASTHRRVVTQVHI